MGNKISSKEIPIQEKIVDLSIVLVCWNNKKFLEDCLNSLYESGMNYSFDVVVSDNGSTDGSQDMLREKFPQVKIIQNDHNLGLGKASNQGIEATQGRYVLLLNNDTLVNGASFDLMVDFLNKNPNVGAVGGKLLNPDGSVQSCHNKFPTLWEEFLIATRLGELLWKGFPGDITDNQLRSVSWTSSACLMLRRKALDQVGLLDEGYFIYGDEADLQYRLKKAGWLIYFLPDATTIHFGGGSMNRWRRRKMVYRGKILFFQKNYGTVKTGILRGLLFILSVAKLLLWSIALIVPNWRDRAKKELNSNIEVIAVCWKMD